MKLVVTMPRLLPMTILAMGLLLCLKSLTLVSAAVPTSNAEPAPPAPKAEGQPAEPRMAEAKAETRPEPKPAESKPQAKGEAKPGEAKAGEGKPAEAKAEIPTKPPAEPPISESERALLLDLRKRSIELDAREAATGAREAVLAAAETRLSRRVDELGTLQKRLEALETARREHDEANWRGLVKLYETMKPREAATIFNDLDMSVLLPVLDRMKETKAALVLAGMQPERARQVTTELAQMRARANAAPAAAIEPPPAKTAGGG